MAVYYKFKSAKDYDSIPTDGHFISVANLKEKVFELKHLGRGTDFDLVVTNAQTNEEYLDEAVLIPRNTSVLVRRVPGRPRMRIVTGAVITHDMEKVEDNSKINDGPTKSSFLGADSSTVENHEDPEWDEFGNDLYAVPEVLPIQTTNPIPHAAPPGKDDEDSKIEALINTPALDWQGQTSDSFGLGRGFGRGMGGRMMGGRGFGRGGLEWKTPPPGYVCHRCKVAGHFIQHCPTNGDHDYDLKRVRPPTGIPKSMLMTTSDGSYVLPSGAVAVLKPNEAAFEKQMDGLPSTRSVSDLPAELHCPLCKEVMKNAVLTSKCCFNSFCDTCIRDHIITKSVCGATNSIADDLLPNKTLRDTINRILESNNSSAGNAMQVQDTESKIPHPKFPSPTSSAASKGEQVPPPQSEETSKVHVSGEVANAPQNTLENGRTRKFASASGVMHDSISLKEPASQGSIPVAKDVLQQKPVSGEAGKKKKKKRDRVPLNAEETQWNVADNSMMPLCPSSYNPYWTGMQAGIDRYAHPYGGPLPYMGYGLGPSDIAFSFLAQDPFGAQGYLMPPGPPQMDLANFGMAFNAGPPIVRREQFEARKADLRRKHEIENRGNRRELSKGGELRREMDGSSGNASSLKPQYKPNPHPSSADHHRSSSTNDHHRRRRQTEKASVDHLSDYPKPQQRQSSSSSSKRKSDLEYDNNHRGHRASVDEDYKVSTSEKAMLVSSRKGVSAGDYESSDDDEDRHFKRRRRSRKDREGNHREY